MNKNQKPQTVIVNDNSGQTYQPTPIQLLLEELARYDVVENEADEDVFVDRIHELARAEQVPLAAGRLGHGCRRAHRVAVHRDAGLV